MIRIKELEKLILKARAAYYNDQPIISDKVFDAWVDELKVLEPTNKAVTNIGSPVAPSVWKKAKHQIPMGSLDKVNTPAELVKWVDDTCPKEDLFVSEKLDGLSIELVYESGKLVQGITRGDGEIGEDITVNVIKMGGVPSVLKGSDFTGSFRGEIILTKANHKKHFADKANPRNAASGVSKRLDGVGVENLDVLLYQVVGDTDFKTEEDQFQFLESFKCKVPNYKVIPAVVNKKKASQLVTEAWRKYQDSVRDGLDYDIDGLVIRLNDLVKQDALGETNLRPKGAIAFKFENEARESTIVDIIWQVGNSGRLTPVAIVDPVSLVGATVTRASLYNIAYIDALQLDIGAKVLVARANDVIPRVEELIKGTGKVAQPPKSCPVCKGKLKMDGENLNCIDVDACPAQIVGRIKNWVSELNILELGETVIEKLVSAGFVSDPSDLYNISVADIASLDRMGEKSAKNVYDSIWKNNPVPLEIFLGGLSITMIGSSTIKLLMDAGYDTLDDILELDADQIEAVKGIGPIKAEYLVNGLVKYANTINNLQANGLKIKKRVIGALTGKTFCFTGSMETKRPILEQMVMNAGGSLKNSVGKGLAYLVIADPNSSSSKAVAARKLGTKLISEVEFLKLAE